MKRWKKILLGILLFVVVAAAALALWQRENLKAVYTFLTKDSETISQALETQRQDQQSKLEQDYHVTVVPPTTQHSSDLLDGKVTPEEVKESLGITQKLEQATVGSDVQAGDLSEEERKLRVDDLIDQCVAELYACQVDLMARLGEMKQAALNQWNALHKSERTTAKKQEIGFAGLEQCYDLEVEIDRQVKDILARYRTELEKLEADTAVLDELWDYYCEKKASEKAYYLDKYLN